MPQYTQENDPSSKEKGGVVGVIITVLLLIGLVIFGLWVIDAIGDSDGDLPTDTNTNQPATEGQDGVDAPDSPDAPDGVGGEPESPASPESPESPAAPAGN